MSSKLPTLERASNGRFSLYLFVAAVLLGAAVKFCSPAAIQSAFDAVKLDSMCRVGALFAALGASIVLHETGHLVAALALRFHVLSICVGPVRLARRYGKWNIQNSHQLLTGSVSAIPRSTENWRAQVLTIVAAGPIFTLLTGLAAFAVLSAGPSEVFLRTFLGALAQFSLFLFLLGLIPNPRTAPVRNDARLFMIFWADSAEAGEIFLYHLITKFEVEGVRPRDYPLALIHVMAAAHGRLDFMLVYAHLICMWALDRGDAATALAWDEWQLQMSKQGGSSAGQAALARSGCLDVLLRNDIESARQKLLSVDIDSLSPAWLRHRTKAAYALASGNIAQTLAEACRGKHSLPARLPLFDFERTLLGRLHRQALEKTGPKEIFAKKTIQAA